MATTFIGPYGKPMIVQEFVNNLIGKLPELFNSEDELRKIWSNPLARKTLLNKLDEAGSGKDELHTLQKIVELRRAFYLMYSNSMLILQKQLHGKKELPKHKAKYLRCWNRHKKNFWNLFSPNTLKLE